MHFSCPYDAIRLHPKQYMDCDQGGGGGTPTVLAGGSTVAVNDSAIVKVAGVCVFLRRLNGLDDGMLWCVLRGEQQDEIASGFMRCCFPQWLCSQCQKYESEQIEFKRSYSCYKCLPTRPFAARAADFFALCSATDASCNLISSSVNVGGGPQSSTAADDDLPCAFTSARVTTAAADVLSGIRPFAARAAAFLAL